MSSKPYGVFNSTGFALGTVWNNLGQVWRLAQPIILPLAMLNAISGFIENDEVLSDNPAFSLIVLLCGLLSFILSSFFVIGWHRLIILGASKENHVRLLDMNKSDIQYILAALGFMICGFMIGLLTVILIILFAKGPIAWVGWLLAIPFCLFCLTILFRASFYLPGKAVGADITIGEAISLGEGLVWRLLLATFLAALVYSVPALIVLTIVIFVFGVLFTLFPSPLLTFLLMFCLSVPALLIGMVSAAIMVSILSRYFLWAVQNKQA